MRRHLLFATVLAAACSVGASAQSGTGQSGQAGQGGTMAQGAYGAEKQSKNQNVTLTGCIESGSQAASNPAGTSGSAATGSDTMGTSGSSSSASRSAADKFVLTNVTGAPAPLNVSDRVSLNGKDGDLKKHVGHKVEITGKWEGGSPSASSSSTAGTSGSTGTLQVSSVKMLAETCPAK